MYHQLAPNSCYTA